MEPLTDSQWDAVRQVDRHLLVAAGAGTGKTTTVVARVLYLLGVPLRDETSPLKLQLRDIGAISYTNAAAADLKRKLRAELRASGLRELAYEVDNARIGTIHSFCGDILREFALRAGWNPAMRVLEETEGAALLAESVHDSLLGALEEKSVAGLDELFALWPVSKVEGWVTRLVGESARLDRIAGEREALEPLERAVLDLALVAKSEAADRLLETGAVDFDRMIVWTRDLLRRDDTVRRALQRRLRTLIVDEFQDVDPVQKEIAYLLGDPASGRADTTRLMLVGDPKQSIFRFRRADVTVWRGVQRDFDAGQGAVVTLKENFRSVEPVLGFVDAAIGPILDRPIDGEGLKDFEVPYQSVKASRKDAALPRGDMRVELLYVDPDDEDAKIAEIRAAEADAIARRARELNEAGIAWRDMAVLLGAWTDTDIYESALRRADIPTYALRTEGFYDRREVLDLILALEALRDPADDRALMGFLRSPFVGVRDETLLEIARQADQPYWDYLHVVEGKEQRLLDWARGLLRDHVALRDRIPTDRLLESLLERSGYLAHLYALGPDADQAMANVRKFLRIIRAMSGDSIGEILRALQETRKRGAREGVERLFGERENVLTITSIHSAKGLEWRVVFWCDLLRTPQPLKDDLLIGRSRMVLKDPDASSADTQPPQYLSMREEEEAEREAERKRLWYVAATRAKDWLILTGLHDEKLAKGCAGKAIVDVLGGVDANGVVKYTGQGGKEFRARVLTTRLRSTMPEVGRAEFVPRELPAPIPPLSVPAGRSRHSATELMLYARCARRHWFRYIAGVREPPVDRSGPEFRNAIARGQIVHEVLEHLDELDGIDPLLEVAIGRWDPDAPTPEVPQGQLYRQELRKDILAVANAPEYRAIADLPDARRELAFLAVLGPGEVAEGKIDLVAPEGNGLAALDVKTGNGDPEKARRKAGDYALQRDMYVTAVERISGLPVNRFAFQFSGAGLQISEAITDEMRQAAAAEIRRLLDAIGQGKPVMTKYPAECRWCGYKREGWCEGATETADSLVDG